MQILIIAEQGQSGGQMIKPQMGPGDSRQDDKTPLNL